MNRYMLLFGYLPHSYGELELCNSRHIHIYIYFYAHFLIAMMMTLIILTIMGMLMIILKKRLALNVCYIQKKFYLLRIYKVLWYKNVDSDRIICFWVAFQANSESTVSRKTLLNINWLNWLHWVVTFQKPVTQKLFDTIWNCSMLF